MKDSLKETAFKSITVVFCAIFTLLALPVIKMFENTTLALCVSLPVTITASALIAIKAADKFF